MLVRRHVPESPRWLFLHGREEEAEGIVREIEREVQAEAGRELSEPDGELVVEQREEIPFREIASVAFRQYPNRAVLGLALFVGQAFLYNAVTFDLGTILNNYFGVTSSAVPYYMVVFAAGNFLGPLLLGRLFDTVGRIPMISGTYMGSAAFVVALALLLRDGSLTRWSFMALLLAAFFLASAGASSAYLTVSEIFPMEMRALSIALFYAIGTAVGGITGPLLFGQFIHSGSADQVATGFLIGAGAMVVGGLAELLFGVRAEGRSLEDIARPLTAIEARAEAAARSTAHRVAERAERRARRLEPRAERIRNRRERERRGAHRYRPGPGRSFTAPGMVAMAGTSSRSAAMADEELDREIELIVRILAERGPLSHDELQRLVNGGAWGPGRFGSAARTAVREGRAASMPHHNLGPPGARAAPTG
jgi:MFS family permease